MDYGYNPMTYMNPYPNPTYTPYRAPSPMLTPQPQGDQIVKVNGIDSARAYPTKPNSMVAIFDANEDVFYVKTTDANNFPTVRRYRFYEEPESVVAPVETIPMTDLYVTKEEFDKFKEEMLNGQQFIRNWKSNGKSRFNEQRQSDKKSDDADSR